MTPRPDWLYADHSDYYHDSIRYFNSQNSTNALTAYAIIALICFYHIVHFLDLGLLSIPELVWNAMVRIIPGQLIAHLDKEYKASNGVVEGDPATARAQDLARKSEAMRRIIGLEGPSMISYLPRPRSFSNMLASTAEPKVKSLPGLGNRDNSCYQNSVIQGLAALPSLSAFLDQMAPRDEQSSQLTSYALKEMTERLNNPSNAGKRLWTPAILKSMSSWQQQDAQEYFSKVYDEVEKESAKAIVGLPQQYGLGMLKNLKNVPKKRRDDGRLALTHRSTTSSHDLTFQSLHKLPSELRSTLLRNPLSGLVAQRVGCLQCGYVEGLSMTPFNCLTLPLGPLPVYDIRSCLDAYTILEHISDIECPKCTLLHHQAKLSKTLNELQSKASDDPQPNSLRQKLLLSVTERFEAIRQALEDQDFADATLLKKCRIPAKSRVLVTKSKQMVVARMPKALVMHVNRSNFDELMGMQSKNHASIRFPITLNLSAWCLGGGVSGGDGEVTEVWEADPAKSLLPGRDGGGNAVYSLKAVVTHRGRHEDGHYICHRRSRFAGEDDAAWWKLSDDTVTTQSEREVLAEGGVFMLFYELDDRASMGVKSGVTVAMEARAAAASVAAASGSNVPDDVSAAGCRRLRAQRVRPPLRSDPEPESAAPSIEPTILTPISSQEQTPIAPPELPAPEPSAPETSSSESSAEDNETPHKPHEPVPDAIPSMWDTQRRTPRMRTASSRSNRGSIGKARGMANVSSMVTAN